MNSRVKFIATQVGVVLAFFICSEATLAFFLNHPSLIPGPLLPIFRTYYMSSDRNVAQFLRSCAQHDDKVTYIYKPGLHRFQNREFDTTLMVNSAGLRDDENSLNAPEIIVLGDSFAMGWGVQQTESFAEVIERKTGMKTLNAGISSFGTVRELELLKRLNTARLKHLIIQYCPNDYDENIEYLHNNRVLPISSREKYEALVSKHEKETAYYFGKHTIGLTGATIRLFKHLGFSFLSTTRDDSPSRAPDEATVFADVLADSHLDRSAFTITVIDVNRRGWNDPSFIRALSTLLARLPKERSKNIKLLDLSSLVNKSQYYTLDDHFTKSGHEIVADAWIKSIQ